MSLLDSLKKITFNDLIKAMVNDEQFVSLKKAYEFCVVNKKEITISDFLNLIVANSTVCYQLSGTGENYWNEFGNWLINKDVSDVNLKNNPVESLKLFLKNSKNNKRLFEMKSKRLDKYEYDEIGSVINNILKQIQDGSEQEGYYEPLIEKLSKIFNQNKNDKTMVFSLKMFSYGIYVIALDGKNSYFNNFDPLKGIPKNLILPIDSRINKFLEINLGITNKKDAVKYLNGLTTELKHPLVAYDAIFWPNIEK